jgi:hypothetical protein
MSTTIQLGHTYVGEAKLANRMSGSSLFLGRPPGGDMRWDSDIDLLLEFLPDAHIDLVDYAGFMLDLSQLMGRNVDLVSKKGLKPLIRASVLKEARLLYAA